MAENLKLPKDVITGDVNIRIMGQSEVFVENYRYIIEYSECVLKLQCRNTKLKISGSKLVIEYYSRDEMLVKGNVHEVVYY